MSPSTWNGIVALCAVVGVLGSFLVYGARLVIHFDRITTAVETLSNTVVKLEGHFQYMMTTLAAHTEQLGNHRERLERVESYLDVDGQVSSLIGRLPHRRRGGNEA